MLDTEEMSHGVRTRTICHVQILWSSKKNVPKSNREFQMQLLQTKNVFYYSKIIRYFLHNKNYLTRQMARAKIGSGNSEKKEMSDGNTEEISTPSDKK